MYLSQVEIDYGNRRKVQDLSHLGAYHHWVEQSFPEEIDSKIRTRKLWRIDSLRGKSYLLVVSPEKPDMNRLEKYGVKGTAKTRDYDQYLASLKAGMEVRFRVVLNPVISISQGLNKRGRVVPHVTAEQQKQFLMERAEKNGFSLCEDKVSIVKREYLPLYKSNSNKVKLSCVTYEGVLKILDTEVFYKTLTQGFGKKKAYGFGMMTVIPIK